MMTIAAFSLALGLGMAPPAATIQQVSAQVSGRPTVWGPNNCPARPNAAEIEAMKVRLTRLVGAPTVEQLAQQAGRSPCPNIALETIFMQIVLGDDVSITKVKP